jgi:hypothetical protein
MLVVNFKGYLPPVGKVSSMKYAVQPRLGLVTFAV